VCGSAVVLTAFITMVLVLTIPSRQPAHQATYFTPDRLAGRFGHDAACRAPSLARPAVMFASFTLFWTACRLNWHGTSACLRPGSLFALVVGALCYMLALIHPAWGLVALVVASVVLGFAAQMCVVLGWCEIYASCQPEPAQRTFHDKYLCRRRFAVRTRQHGLRAWRLEARGQRSHYVSWDRPLSITLPSEGRFPIAGRGQNVPFPRGV
jgi:hypothetical protein